jgi:hypothetical protein
MSGHRIDLPGLTGHNLLGFLAAVGLLRITSRLSPEEPVRMGWQALGGFWVPWLELPERWAGRAGEGGDLRDGLVSAVHRELTRMVGHSAFAFADDLTVSVEEWRSRCREAVEASSPSDRVYADVLAAFGADGLPAVDKSGRMQDTAFRTMSGAGHQHFLQFMRKLTEGTEERHLRAAVFASWEYLDEGPSMRWDFRDDRRYALRWADPSGDAVRTVRGANRLAIEALPLFPTAPVGRVLRTTGFSERRESGVCLTWPIWAVPVSVETVRSLLALGELQVERPDRRALAARGVVEVYRCQRVTQGKYRNFTPGVPVPA